MAVDYSLIGEAIRGLCSQAIADGMLMQREQANADPEPLNARAQGLLALIKAEVEAELLFRSDEELAVAE